MKRDTIQAHDVNALRDGGSMQKMSIRSAAFTMIGLSFYWLAFKRPFLGSLLAGGWASNQQEVQAAHFVFLASIVIALLFCLFSKSCREFILRRFDYLLAILCASSFVGNIFITIFWPPLALSIFVMILNALSITLLTFGWMRVFVLCPFRNRLIIVFSSFAVSCAIGALSSLIDQSAGASVLLPAISGLPLLIIASQINKKKLIRKVVPHEKIPTIHSIVLITAFLIVSGLGRGILYGGAVASPSPLGAVSPSILSMILSLTAIPALFISKEKQAMQIFWLAASTLLILGLFALVLGYGEVDMMRAIVLSARTCLTLILWISLAQRVNSEKPESILKHAMLFMAIDAISSIVTYVIVPALVPDLSLSSSLSIQYVAFSAVLLLLLAFWVLGLQKSREHEGVIHDSSEADAPSTKFSAIDSNETGKNNPRIAFVALMDERGLTKREQQISLLVAEGHTMKKISDLLGVSLGTIQSHTKSIYRKLNVHNKQAIIDLWQKMNS